MTPENNPAAGKPGEVRVSYVDNLYKGFVIHITVGEGGPGGKGGFALRYPNLQDVASGPEEAFLGGRGGGRENYPIINAFLTYEEICKDNQFCPISFTTPGVHEVEWPYETPTATVVVIGGDGGGQGGTGWVLPGEEGKEGGPGAIFFFPTYL